MGKRTRRAKRVPSGEYLARSAAYQAGKSYVGRKNELFQPEAWREGENSQGFREKGGSAITSSEMRHAIRMGENSTVHFVGGAEI